MPLRPARGLRAPQEGETINHSLKTRPLGEGQMYTRRDFLQTGSLAAATLAAPYVKTVRSAGQLKLLVWDHWVVGAGDEMKRIISDWGAKNGVEVTIDTKSEGIAEIAQAEARAQVGHDIVDLGEQAVWIHQELLEPVDDTVTAIELENGPYTSAASHLAELDGAWRAVPMAQGSFTYPMVSRIDLFKEHAGIDVLELFPIEGQRDPALVDTWDYALLLKAAKKLHAAGHPIGLPISAAAPEDSPFWLEPMFLAFGATMVDENGNITINSDATRTVLEYLKELAQYLPADVYGWNNASNNRWIVSGNGGAICNPPSAWSVARRDRPDVAEQLFHHDMPRGPKGRFRGIELSFWGIWKFAANQAAAKELLVHLASREVAERLLAVGYDVPLLQSHAEHPVWEAAEPPKGTLYNYPVRGDEQLVTIGYPAPLRVSAVMHGLNLSANLASRVTQAGEPVADAIAWAEQEIEGFMRR
jgi:hypothetical protein